MKTASFTLVIPTIGISELFDELKSVASKDVIPDQVIVVIDLKGRSLSPLEGTIEELEQRILETLPYCEILHNAHDEDWQMNNQTFNIGIEHARHDYVYVTHDDVVYPDDPLYFEKVGLSIETIKKGLPKRVVGSVFPACHEEIQVTSPSQEAEGLIQYYSAVSSLLSVDYWREVGKFDLTHGIWWDAQIQGELWKNDCWMYYTPLQPVTHFMNRALRQTKHSHDWKKAPLWQACGKAFERVYGGSSELWENWYGRKADFILL
jgi:hypothetical protein